MSVNFKLEYPKVQSTESLMQAAPYALGTLATFYLGNALRQAVQLDPSQIGKIATNSCSLAKQLLTQAFTSMTTFSESPYAPFPLFLPEPIQPYQVLPYTLPIHGTTTTPQALIEPPFFLRIFQPTYSTEQKIFSHPLAQPFTTTQISLSLSQPQLQQLQSEASPCTSERKIKAKSN
jgi:hypothetical protein